MFLKNHLLYIWFCFGYGVPKSRWNHSVPMHSLVAAQLEGGGGKIVDFLVELVVMLNPWEIDPLVSRIWLGVDSCKWGLAITIYGWVGSHSPRLIFLKSLKISVLLVFFITVDIYMHSRSKWCLLVHWAITYAFIVYMINSYVVVPTNKLLEKYVVGLVMFHYTSIKILV